MLRNPEFYSIDPNIVKWFLHAFYRIMWDKNNQIRSKLFLDLLQGNSIESAFIEVKMNKECAEAGVAPLIDSKKAGVSVFIDNTDVAD